MKVVGSSNSALLRWGMFWNVVYMALFGVPVHGDKVHTMFVSTKLHRVSWALCAFAYTKEAWLSVEQFLCGMLASTQTAPLQSFSNAERWLKSTL